MFHLPDAGPFAVLILGGARSGKSRYGEALVTSARGNCVYVATAEARDDEMSERISHHQNRRGTEWRLIEEPIDLPGVLRDRVGKDDVVLIDCLTLWLGNLMEAGADITAATSDLLAAIKSCPGRLVFISNEVGQGIVPDNAMARQFRDEAGWLHQSLAAEIDAVLVVMAGLPLILKAPSQG
ncbi:MAG: bifunctional adenosylcobinamide kinase/adenosylcobinamide-phosphate guanylyltransferase [Rhodobiaceae bacterium]|nr:bifunctional adenosylcobinamide kinase/adenosylcobinamide-phosphate guanylyltransferase [Rhodobiaceae bacterium]